MPQTLRRIRADPVADDTAMPHAVADELDALAARIVALGDSLSDDAALVARHIVGLQDIDRVAQMLDALAAVLRADDVDTTLETLPMRELALRLARRLGV